MRDPVRDPVRARWIDPLAAPTGPRRGRRVTVAAVAAVLVLGAGCGDDSPGGGAVGGAGDPEPDPELDGEIPSPGVTVFTEGEFDDIRLPRGATEASEKTEREGVITQSFTVTATSPQQIMDFFQDSLATSGWEVVEPVRQRGTETLFGAWRREGRRLEVAAGPAVGVEDERTQFSVVLLPSLAEGDEIRDRSTTTTTTTGSG